ncbi:MAG: nitrogen fixation protein [Leptolyngbyaceae cyanobacterium CRU_2_3]|nr:nitrogen fixation protein [Leptolyngbyaceae cyanobacterium CRU_2_3]
MKHTTAEETAPLCPSAQPEMAESVIFGVIKGTLAEPRLTHLAKPRPVTDELLRLASPVKPTEVFRFAAPCANNSCQHFDGSNCRLAKRIVDLLPAVETILPPCQIRSSCRWWQQEGKTACLRCPQIVTETYNPSEPLNQAADPQSR